MSAPRGLVAFDLDGTSLRGRTVCELLAAPLGRRDEMRRFEALSGEAALAAAREEMARWYAGRSEAELCTALRFFVGVGPPPALSGLVHRPDGESEAIAREILAHFAE